MIGGQAAYVKINSAFKQKIQPLHALGCWEVHTDE